MCEKNTFKSTVGHGKCQACLPGWIANKNKTKCYDTYKNLTIRFTDDSSVLMLSVSGVILSAISSSIFFYIKYNETPLVRSSNLILSCIQLSSQLLLVIILPFIFIGEPNTIICILRPTLIGILMTVSTSVTLSKTRTLLRIFNSKIKMSNRERMKTKTVEIFILLLFTSVAASILFISFKVLKPKEDIFISDTEKYRKNIAIAMST